MAFPNTKLERFRLFLNDPLIRKDQQNVSNLSIQASLNHIMKSERPRGGLQNLGASHIYSSNVPKHEFQQALDTIEDFHTKIASLENTTANLKRTLDLNLVGLEGDERKASALLHSLNHCFQDLGLFYHKIDFIREGMIDVMARFGIVYKTGDDRIENRLRYGGMRDSERPLFHADESPIKISSSLVLDHNEPYNIRLKSAGLNESEKLRSIQNEKERLENENKALVNRIEFYNQQKEGHNVQIQYMQNEIQTLKDKLGAQAAMLKNLEAENSSLQSRSRQQQQQFSSIKETPDRTREFEQKEMAMYAEKKKLIEKNEGFIVQISELRQEKTQAQNMLKMKTAEVEKLNEAGKKVTSLEADISKKNEAIVVLSQQLKAEKAKNYDTIERFKALENAYKHSLANPTRFIEEIRPVEQPIGLNQTLESRVDQSVVKPQEIEPLSASDQAKPLNGAGVALMGMIKTILEGQSPTKPNPRSNPNSTMKSATKDPIQSPERTQKINAPNESLNKSQLNTSSPERNTSGDYFQRMKQSYEAERAKNAMLASDLQRLLNKK